jgi:hypothetical protein
MATVTRREFWDRLELALYGSTWNTFSTQTALLIDALYDDLVAQPAPATVTRERDEQEAFDEQMRLLRKAARHSEYRGDDDAAEACRWAESRMRHERAAALASPPAEDELQRHDCEAWAMEGIGCAHCNPVALAIRAAQAPPASDPPWSAEATLKSLEIGFCSSNCGPVYRADEDGCCVTCGGDITFHDRSWPLGQTRCTVCQDTALPCQLGHTGRMLGSRSAAQAPPGLVDLMARWQRAERAWQQAQDETGQVYEPEGLWEERHELFEAMLAYPLPASPQAETNGDE